MFLMMITGMMMMMTMMIKITIMIMIIQLPRLRLWIIMKTVKCFETLFTITVMELVMILIMVLIAISSRFRGLKYGIASKNSTVRKPFGNNTYTHCKRTRKLVNWHWQRTLHQGWISFYFCNNVFRIILSLVCCVCKELEMFPKDGTLLLNNYHIKKKKKLREPPKLM